MNEHQKKRFASNMLKHMFRTVTGKKIAMFGFAFKKDTGDTRESAAAYVAKYLLDERAEIHCFDPKVKEDDMWLEFKYTLGLEKAAIEGNINLCNVDPYATCAGAHAIAVMTEWDCFKEYDCVSARLPCVLLGLEASLGRNTTMIPGRSRTPPRPTQPNRTPDSNPQNQQTSASTRA